MKNALTRWATVNTATLLSLLTLVPAANAGPLLPAGTYQLHSLAVGALAPPNYGLRLDELVDVTLGTHDFFTWDFDHPSSNMRLDWNGTDTMHIYGQAYGGVVNPGVAYLSTGIYAPYLGVYNVDFTYNMRVQPVAGDMNGFQDIEVLGGSPANTGTIQLPGGLGTVNLVDFADASGRTIRFGDQGAVFFGVPDIAAWGWLAVVDPNGVVNHRDGHDWLFGASPVPEPTTMSLIGGGLVLLGIQARRRRHQNN